MNFFHLMADSKATSLQKRLHDYLGMYRNPRSVWDVHASSLIEDMNGEFCPRAVVIMQMLNAKPKRIWLPASMRMTFAIGDMVHDQVVDWFAEMGIAYGHWKCISCGSLHEFRLRPIACSKCGVRKFKHVEMVFRSPKSGVVGSTDLALDLGVGKFRLLEIKSIDKEEFKKLITVKGDHRWRTQVYLRLVEEAGEEIPFYKRIDTTKAKVLYVSKGGYGTMNAVMPGKGVSDKFSPFKEYEVLRDDAKNDDILGLASKVKRFNDGEEGVPAGICPTSMCKRAKSCTVVMPCFSGKYPPGKMKADQHVG